MLAQQIEHINACCVWEMYVVYWKPGLVCEDWFTVPGLLSEPLLAEQNLVNHFFSNMTVLS